MEIREDQLKEIARRKIKTLFMEFGIPEEAASKQANALIQSTEDFAKMFETPFAEELKSASPDLYADCLNEINRRN